MSNFLTEYTSIIENMVAKYTGNEYSLQRLDFHLKNLEQTIDTENNNYSKRIIRTNNLAIEQEMFIEVFLSQNKYYFIPIGDGCFYQYDGKNYAAAKEDDILHKILTTISYDSGLQDWKYKTKNSIIKQIKGNNLLATIPESATIQSVLKRLCPAVFPNRETAKYFLTILGDNILKKNKDNIYLVNGKSKAFLSQLDEYAYLTIGHANITKNFIKYHESHDYQNCRLCIINDHGEDIISIEQSLNLFCVACHYSNRFDNADEFVSKKCGESLKNYAFYLKNNNMESIVEIFCKNMIIPTENEQAISSTFLLKWKDMHYLWKCHLSFLNMPNMIYSTKLKQILIKKYAYSEMNDCFINITSKHLPRVQKFLTFWNENIEVDVDDDLEIDELVNLSKNSCGNYTDAEILKIISHFFPEVTIREGKYLTNVSCKLWDKPNDIKKSLEALKNEFREKHDDSFVSFDKAYNFYCKYFNNAMIVSKNYFENYLHKHFAKHIQYNTFLHNEWYYEK